MTKNPFDQFSKQLLEEFLSPFGVVQTNFEVSGEPQYVDVYFEPNAQAAVAAQEIGLLGRIAQTPCLFEPFRNQPTPFEIRDCLKELYQVHGTYQRKARREQESLQEEALPYLWILSASASENLLNGFGAYPSEEWGPGIYLLHHSLRAAIVALNQIPATEETFLLRILGKGQTQKQAINELIAFDDRDPRRSAILKLLTSWKISTEITGQVDVDEELMMVLTQAYLDWEQQTEQKGKDKGRQEGKLEGRQEGKLEGERSLILRLLTRRIGDVSLDLQAQIQSLSLSQLESLGEALLDFSQPSDLVDWLASQA
jgi:Domain of unknown function (DUF4351)